MLTKLCQTLRNWWDVDRWYGDFVISDGAITWANGDALDLQSGQYFRIIGSVFNDGVHQYPDATLNTETFSGSVWALAIPAEVVSLAEEMAAWETQYGASAASPYQSESFGGYSYSKAAGASGSGTASVWDAFRAQLNQWRKI